MEYLIYVIKNNVKIIPGHMEGRTFRHEFNKGYNTRCPEKPLNVQKSKVWVKCKEDIPKGIKLLEDYRKSVYNESREGKVSKEILSILNEEMKAVPKEQREGFYSAIRSINSYISDQTELNGEYITEEPIINIELQRMLNDFNKKFDEAYKARVKINQYLEDKYDINIYDMCGYLEEETEFIYGFNIEHIENVISGQQG